MIKKLFITGKHRPLWVFLLFVLCLFKANDGMATDDWSSGWNSISYDRRTGCMHYVVRYFQTWGGLGDGHCGFLDDGWLNITQRSSKEVVIYVRGSDVSVSTGNIYNKKRYDTGGGEYESYVEFDIPLTQPDLDNRTKIEVNFKGTWWRRGWGIKNNHPDHNYSVDISCSKAVYKDPVVSYANNTNEYLKPRIKIDWERAIANTNIGSYGDLYLCDANSGKETSVAGITKNDANNETSGSFYLYVTGDDCLNLSQTKEFQIKQIYKTENADVTYTTLSPKFVVKAYPQILEKGFLAEFNPDNLCIDLSWELSGAPSSDYDDSPFLLTTTKNGVFQKTDTISYVSGKSKYELSYPLKKDEKATYEFIIRRKSTDGFYYWDCFDRTQSVEVITGHCYPVKPSAKLSADNESVDLKWTVSGSVWTDGTKFSIIRTNLTTSTTYEYILDKDEYKKGALTDNLVQLCNKYSYDFKLVPGSNKYDTKNLHIDSTFTPTQIGNVEGFEASKGYYSDKVTLSWKTTSAFDEIAVECREYNNPKSSFKKIQTVAALSSSDYVFEDKSCRPGVMYEYRVYGVLNCGGELKTSKDTLTAIGFRTPTGDFYGRVTFEDGQAVDSVEVRLESEDNIKSTALSFAKDGQAVVPGANVLSGNSSVTMQAWIKPDATTTDSMVLVRKSDVYELGLLNGKVYFKAGNVSLLSKSKVTKGKYTHVTAVYNKVEKKIYLYLNAKLNNSKTFSSVKVNPNTGGVFFGENYDGEIDEVRLWSRALLAGEIKKDYTRYLVGNENQLDAYYTFDFLSDSEFFDRSYVGTEYNGNNGKMQKVTAVQSTLTASQLSYKGVTNTDGSYSIRAVPYYGNGTAYSLTPSKGTHQFSPVQEVRFINAEAQSHTVNFTDNSSFDVSGTVVYSGGTYPVEGAMFTIDGSPVMKNNEMVMTNADGEFSFSVPVGKHEVKVVKAGHNFEFDGRICNSDGSDRNYQDMVSGLLLKDETKVKYIGRVAGGTVQEAYPVGHSLSKNNLANNITVKLTHTRPNYKMQDSLTVTEKHFVPKHALSKKATVRSNKVDYVADGVVIHVNNATGEFVAYVVPETYKVEVTAKGYSDINGSGALVDFSSVAARDSSVSEYTYQDSIKGVLMTFHDTVKYNKMQQFIKRNKPTLQISQCKGNGTAMDYFGVDSLTSSDILGNTIKVGTYNKEDKSYYFGMPVYAQGQHYYLRADVYEAYKHSNTGVKDVVPVRDAEVEFTVKFAEGEKSYVVEADTNGYAFMGFQAGEPELTTATSTLSAKVKCGDSEKPTTITWKSPFANTVYVTGGHIRGTNFVTAGPDRLLTVLRDPPGSNSYSFLEKGVSFTETSTYTGSIQEEGEVGANIATGAVVRLMTGAVAPGTATLTSTAQIFTQTNKVTCAHDAAYEGSNSKTNTTTLTTRYETSDDPLYVGADGDVYIGYSTNLFFGESDLVALVSKEQYHKNPKQFDVIYTDTTNNDYMLAKSVSVNMGQSFGTLFAYPQVYIEQTLLPNMEGLRNSLLLPKGTDVEKIKKQAEETGETYYISYLSEDDPDYGKSNSDTTIANKSNGDPKDVLNGPSYRVIKKSSELKKDSAEKDPYIVSMSDTISILNQWIDGWVDKLKANEEAKAYFSDKVSADEKVGNYSFHAGSPVEYSEEYSTGRSHSSSFHVTVGLSTSEETDVETENFAYTATTLTFEETVTTTQGGTFESEVERSHSKGFVLKEEGDDDYISVDVFHEKGWKSSSEEYDNPVSGGMVDTTNIADKDEYSSFIFITRGGATSCPYEKGLVTKYYKPKTTIGAATLQLEVPSIAVENDFVENVPSGEDAYLTLYMRNNSETSEDQWFDLRLVDASNPDGAVVSIDGNSMSGFALDYLVPAGETLVKTIAVTKGRALNYDNLQLVLASKCQADPTSFLDIIADTVSFSVHFIPSCSDVEIVKPSNNWTYNTKCDTQKVDGVVKHYMPIEISGFDVNYTDFEHIELQYKSAAASDKEWVTLMYYYAKDSLTKQAVKNGLNAQTIKPGDGGVISYKFFMDALPDQKYDLRAVSYCNINNELFQNESQVVSGIKDMYNPRLFGTPSPANGVLTISDDVRINFNETIAEGMLSKNNFSVTGMRNGVETSHDVAIALDGKNGYLATDAARDLSAKNLTMECWVNFTEPHKATFFSHGNSGESIELGMDADGKLTLKVGAKSMVSKEVPAWEYDSWNHVAFAYEPETKSVSAFVNYTEMITSQEVPLYTGNGTVNIGRSISTGSNYFKGKVDQFRIWNDVRSVTTIQANSNKQLSGNEIGLISYYDMEEAKGSVTEDKARGANLVMKSGAQWSLPAGKSVSFTGDGYVKLNSASAVITDDMDFTLEFWFKAEKGAKNQTLLSSGKGTKDKYEDCSKVFSVSFDENGKLCFVHNNTTNKVSGSYADGSWHSFALAVNRSSGLARIYMDGALNTYFSAEKIGSIAASRIIAGARVYNNQKKDAFDNQFTGSIDEVRLWNLYRQQNQLEKFYNEKLDGTEKGLRLYYPFETYKIWQGTPELQTSLVDKANSSAKAKLNGSASFSDDIPAVKTKAPVSSLLFDYVVNNDAIIINLKEEDYRIENTIVTFTADDIRDVNGNSTLSPITWSAYISRNQLKWQDNSVEISRDLDEEYQFEMPIVNKGGAVQNYTIDNLPSWLTASPAEGTINPLQTVKVKFTVDKSLNVGTYDEVAYLTNDNNVSEPLDIKVVVKGQVPNWTVNDVMYEYNMSVIGKMSFNNVFSNDENDILAAFYKGKCVGVAHSTYNAENDMWYAMLTIYCDQISSKDITFRMYDASTGIVYDATPSKTIEFKNNSVVGTTTAPVVFNSKKVTYHNIDLRAGWNWISFNLKNSDISDINAYIGSANWGNKDVIKNMKGFASYSSKQKGWVSDSKLKLDNTSMFMVYSEKAQTLTISGTPIDVASTPLTIAKSKWNYISYLPTVNMPIKNALASYEAQEGDVIKSVKEFAMYHNNSWVGSLTYMEPGKGYMLLNKSTKEKKLTYPSSASTLKSAAVHSSKAANHSKNMSVVGYVEDLQEGDKLYAVANGVVVGEALSIDLNEEQPLQFISIEGEDDTTSISFVLERDGVSLLSSTRLSYAADAVYGSIDNPVNIEFAGVEEPAIAVTIHPVPAQTEAHVSAQVGDSKSAKVTVFDVEGNVVYSTTADAVGGEVVVTLNVTTWTDGAYVVRVEADSLSQTQKLIVKK